MANSPKPPRGDKRDRTRAKLIAATLAVIGEAGFAGASLEAIARRAGVTRGSIYSNFAGRDALMLAAVGSQGMQLDRDFSQPMPLKAQLRGFAERLLDQLPAGASGGELVIGYALYAMTQPQQRVVVAKAYSAMFARIAGGPRSAIRRSARHRRPCPGAGHPGAGDGRRLAVHPVAPRRPPPRRGRRLRGARRRCGTTREAHFGCGATLRYGFSVFQPPGHFALACSSETEVGMMTSSPGCQFTGVATVLARSAAASRAAAAPRRNCARCSSDR